MNVSDIARVYGGNQNTAVSSAAKGKETSAATNVNGKNTEQDTESGAYSVDLGKNLGATAEAYDAKGTAKTKGLSSDAVSALQQQTDNSYMLMIQTMTEQNAKLQGWLSDGIGKLNFGGLEIDTSKFALPAVATTPEEAEKAIAPGGDWSVDAVATRIFDMASTLANGDPDKLLEMQDAVEKGFEQAGIAFKDAMGVDDMPQITKDTNEEIKKRFNDLYNKLTGAPDNSTGAAENTDVSVTTTM